MENKNMIIAAVIAIVVVVAAVGAYMVFSGNGNDNGQDEPTGDTYYVYLDGMGDINGWYTGTGADAEEAMVSALTAKGITVDTSGWGIQINDFIQDGSNGYAIYGYCSNTTENAWAGYFFTGPVIENVTSNIIYISYGPYTMDAEYNIKYDVVPTDALMSTGPFATA